MTKELKNYLHLYIGCECVVSAVGDFSENWKPEIMTGYHTLPQGDRNQLFQAVKPILRPLSDMTEEERHEFFRDTGYTDRRIKGIISDEIVTPTKCMWLLKKGFDIFELIKDGLAIDKTKLK